MEALRINGRLVIPADELNISFSRSSGPGGQNVNKVATRVSLRFSIPESRVLGDVRRARLLDRLRARLTVDGELIVHSSRTRHRARNIDDARERLAVLIRDALQVQRARRATRPTRASKARRLQSKRRRGDVKRQRRADAD